MMFFRRSRLLADERGAAIIELAIIAPVFALMTIGVVDMSNAYSRKLQAEQAAQRAVEKIMQTTQDDTVENTLKTEVKCQINGGSPPCAGRITDADVVVTWRLECTSGGTITAQTATDPTVFDGLTCPVAGSTEARYIQVTVNDKYTPMFPIHFAAFNGDGTYHLSATAGMRTQ
jgi:Flp pilus assembly protein TadG